MLLTIDIGNSAAKLGVFDHEKIIARLAVPTIRKQTAASLADSLENELNHNFSAVVISSVVPELNTVFREFSEKRFGLAPLFVDSSFDFGFSINYHPRGKIGADRLVAAFAATEKYGRPVVVCDFGTATTIEVVNSKNEYLGGIITPGINTLSDALYLKTSKLPRVEIKKPETVIGNSTVSCIESGIFYGYLGLTEGLLRRISDELGEKPRIVATGGFAQLIADSCELIETVDENLILEGLRIIYEKKISKR